MMALASVGASVPVPPAHHGHCLDSSAVGDVMTLPVVPVHVGLARERRRLLLAVGEASPALPATAAG